MDSTRFDNLARRLSRRKAIGAAGASGLVAAVTRVVPAAAQGRGMTVCQMTVEALTSAGPSTGQTYNGVLEITLAPDGAVNIGNFTPSGGIAAPVVGQANSRALSLRVTFADGQALVFTGTAENDLVVCSGQLSGVFGGPQLGDVGQWRIDPSQSQRTGTGVGGEVTATSVPATLTPTPTPCPDMTCDSPFVLDPNSCQCTCPAPTELCGPVCCPAGSDCTDATNGECSCPSGTELCIDSCVSLCETGSYLDPTTCQCVAGCGIGSCPEGQQLDTARCLCVDICTGAAPYYCNGNCYTEQMVNCSGACYPASNVNSNPNMCGASCQVCPPGVPCIAGSCQCPYGYNYCQGAGCKSLSDDNSNCGNCGNACTGGTTCQGGTCQ